MRNKAFDARPFAFYVSNDLSIRGAMAAVCSPMALIVEIQAQPGAGGGTGFESIGTATLHLPADDLPVRRMDR